MADKGQLVPYELVKPGWEGVYTGERADKASDSTDAEGNVIRWWSTWPFADDGRDFWQWDDEVKLINRMQEAVGPLSDETRRLRIHVGGIVLCDSGVPVSVDELLSAIGSGMLPAEPFRVGCWAGEGRTTQPHQAESIRIIESVLLGYLAGKPEEHLLQDFSHAAGFVSRTYQWLGPSQNLTQLQKLMLERMLLPFEYFTRSTHASFEQNYSLMMQVSDNCFENDGKGTELDKRICELADLPEIQRLRYGMYEKNVKTITDPEKRELYTICTRIACGVYELSDCHHNTFRVIENQICGIAKGRMGEVPGRLAGAERERLGRLLFGYALALDKWLLGMPMQFLLLDLGHVDLGFNPKNDIVRVYAHLGEEHTPVKQWLAACLWYNLYHSPMGGLKPLVGHDSSGHPEILARAKQAGISARNWMDSQLKKTDNKPDAGDA